jgi:hypothetical protein
MIDREAALCLPLVHHLVQHRVLHLAPRVPRHVTPTQGDLQRVSVPEVDAQFAKPTPHPSRKADGDLAQHSAKVLGVEPVVELTQAMKQKQISRSRALAPARAACRRVLLHGKVEKFPLGRTPERSRKPGIKEPDDGEEDPVGREGVSLVEPEYSPNPQAYHDGPIRVGDDPIYIPKSEESKPAFEGTRFVHGPWSPPATETATWGRAVRAKEEVSDRRKRRVETSQRKCWMCTARSSIFTRLNTDGRP